jgi:hypothetical protein
LIRQRVRVSAVIRDGRVIAVRHIAIIKEEAHPMEGLPEERIERDSEV